MSTSTSQTITCEKCGHVFVPRKDPAARRCWSCRPKQGVVSSTTYETPDFVRREALDDFERLERLEAYAELAARESPLFGRMDNQMNEVPASATADYGRLSLSKGDVLIVYDGDHSRPYEAVVDHVETRGRGRSRLVQPYVIPTGGRSPKYLFHERVVKK